MQYLFAVEEEVLESFIVDLKEAMHRADTDNSPEAKSAVLDILEHIGLMDAVTDYLDNH